MEENKTKQYSGIHQKQQSMELNFGLLAVVSSAKWNHMLHQDHLHIPHLNLTLGVWTEGPDHAQVC